MFSHINYHSSNRHQTFRVWRLFKLYEEAWVLADLLPVRPRSSITPEAGSLIARDYLSQVCRVEWNSGKPLKTDHIWIPFNPLAERLSAGCFGERESVGGCVWGECKGRKRMRRGSMRVSNIPTLSSWLSRPLLWKSPWIFCSGLECPPAVWWESGHEWNLQKHTKMGRK